MAMDQSHEQLNRSIKGESGAVRLTEDPAYLRKWKIAGSELSTIVAEFEDTLCDVSASSSKHLKSTTCLDDLLKIQISCSHV